MTDQDFLADARAYLAMLHKRRALVSTCVGVALLLATLYNYTTRPLYEASCQLLIDRDTANVVHIEATLMRLSEMVGRRLREQQLHARTLQLKLRYKDFTTITRAHSLEDPTQLDNEIYGEIHKLFHTNWRRGLEIRLLGVHASSFSNDASQASLLGENPRVKWEQALSAADRLRDRFGESSITLGTGMKGGFRERTHENPAALPGKNKPHK